MLERLLNDLRYSARILRKSKGLTLVAILSLAIGIGSNAAIFSLVNSILLRPPAVSRPDELVQLYVGERDHPYENASYPSYLDLRERNSVFTGLAGYSLGHQFNLAGANDVEQVWGEVVSGNYFDVLGVRPHRGRGFLPEEDEVAGRNPVVIIGYNLWQRRFDSDPSVVGRKITINGQPVTIVGVAPRAYTGTMRGFSTELWVPALTMPLLDPAHDNRITSRGSRWFNLIGRLKPGTTIEQARSNFDLLTKELQAAQPREWNSIERGEPRVLWITVKSERESRVPPQMRAPVYAFAALLFVIVDLVLVMACINLASMFFARAVARRGEIAVRLALGAGRSRIISQLLTESVLLSVIAGAIGTLLAFWSLAALMTWMPALPEGIRVAIDLRPDWRVIAYTVVFSILTGVLFGLAPALHAARGSVSLVLKDEGSVSARFRRSRARMGLVITQVAFSLLLLIGAGLVLRSLEKVRPTRLGYASQNYLIAPITLNEGRYDTRSSQQFFEQLATNIGALPGVRAVSLTDGVPGGFMSRTRRSTNVEGYTPAPGEDMQIDASVVGPRYFTNMQLPIVAGRDFDPGDRTGAPCVAMVNEAFAQRYLGGTSAALSGQLIQETQAGEQRCAIVGVFRDNSWQSLNREVRPFFALPMLQWPEHRMALLVETADPRQLLPAVRREIRRLDPNLAVGDVRPIGDYLGTMAYPFKLFGMLLIGCGVMALLLALVGIYGTISYTIAQRKREVGIRMALGAANSQILQLLIGQNMTVVGVGLTIGLLLSFALTRVLTSLPEMELLFGVSATDALTFAGVTLLLALVALVACYLPARRATRTDVMVTLRNE